MCGIAGFVTELKTDRREILRNMIKSIRYRGPDETGFYIGETAALGHARLSIMDPENGRQPCFNEDESLAVIFNGEIFNFHALREELLQKGHRLDNLSDTAILPHLYEEYGFSMFSKLNGQFAIAIWEKRRRRLILARDRFGEKPLYYSEKNGVFCFASEAKAIFASGFAEAKISPVALQHVFTFWTTLEGESAFRGISQLSAGCYLIYENGSAAIKRYWEYSFSIRREAAADVAAARDRLEELLVASVKNRMISDVPISFYLSGGLDSSLLTGIAATLTNQPLSTFSLTFDDERFDESPYQDCMAKQLGARHNSVRFSRGEIPELLRDVIYHTEVPLLRSGAFPMYVLANLVKSHDTKVVLSGEGSDELFGGYDIFREAKIREFCARVPQSQIRPGLYKRVNQFVKGLNDQSAGSLSYFYQGSDEHSPYVSHLTRWKLGSFARQFFTPEYREVMRQDDPILALGEILPSGFESFSPVQRAQALEFTTLFSNYLLSSQGDRVSMGSGVECRCPFLDYELFDFAASLSDRLKIKGLKEKYLVKKLAEKYVPEQIIKRQKFPYRAPIDILDMMKRDEVRAPMSEAAIRRYGIFQPEAVKRFLSAALSKESANERDCMLFLGILTTQILTERFVEKRS